MQVRLIMSLNKRSYTAK